MNERGNGEGTISRRAGGRDGWQARLSYEDPTTGERKRLALYGTTHAETKAKLNEARKRRR